MIAGKDYQEVMARIAQLRNEIKIDVNDSWSKKISDLFTQFTSFTEKIIEGQEKLMNKMQNLQEKSVERHKELFEIFNGKRPQT